MEGYLIKSGRERDRPNDIFLFLAVSLVNGWRGVNTTERRRRDEVEW